MIDKYFTNCSIVKHLAVWIKGINNNKLMEENKRIFEATKSSQIVNNIIQIVDT